MIWGYAGLVVIAFLLTAVATWTGQPPTRGGALAGLTAFWLAARIAAFIPGWGAVASGIAGTVFFWYGAVCMAIPVYRSRNKRNYIAVFAIFVLGGTHVAFHRHLSPLDGMALLNGLVAGLIMVAAFIGLIGTRIISFFTSKREHPASAQPSMAGTLRLGSAHDCRHADRTPVPAAAGCPLHIRRRHHQPHTGLPLVEQRRLERTHAVDSVCGLFLYRTRPHRHRPQPFQAATA